MKILTSTLAIFGALLMAIVFVIGCESSDTTSTSVHTGFYYGASYYDTWYHGPDYYPPDVIVTPPPNNPGSPPRPAHPIATPPSSAPRPTPMPSIPSRPRVSGRR
jgi:hypothetical protein